MTTNSISAGTTAFDELCRLLADEIQDAVQSFAAEHGLGQLDPEGLHQMSVKLPAVAQEALMFGLNVWPDDLPGGPSRA